MLKCYVVSEKKFWLVHTVCRFRVCCCSHCIVRGSCFIFVLCIYVRVKVTLLVSPVKQEQPTLSEITLILRFRVWVSVSCFVDICLYFSPLTIVLSTRFWITPLVSSNYSEAIQRTLCTHLLTSIQMSNQII